MQPTRAPWAPGGPHDNRPPHEEYSKEQSSVELPLGHHTGAPVQFIISASPGLPEPRPAECPQTWHPASKVIKSQSDIQKALRSNTLANFVAFTMALNDSVIGLKNSTECVLNQPVQKLLSSLDQLSKYVRDTPSAKHEVRYGNPAFRDWFDKMKDAAPEIIYDILGEDLGEATIEIIPYFLDSFGNRTRIDYGTGHETNFVCFLYCLFSLGVLRSEDCRAVVLRVFLKYLVLMREIQTTYWLEPAGSHGVWGLDEYHFFPFLWGAAQLRDHDLIKPKSISNDEILDVYAEDFMYVDAVKFIRKVKKGPLHETSPMIFDITAVPHWEKVNTGLFKMYQVEVLSKVPIMQHFLWGSLIPFPQG